jgi:hypothetical protein
MACSQCLAVTLQSLVLVGQGSTHDPTDFTPSKHKNEPPKNEMFIVKPTNSEIFTGWLLPRFR